MQPTADVNTRTRPLVEKRSISWAKYCISVIKYLLKFSEYLYQPVIKKQHGTKSDRACLFSTQTPWAFTVVTDSDVDSPEGVRATTEVGGKVVPSTMCHLFGRDAPQGLLKERPNSKFAIENYRSTVE